MHAAQHNFSFLPLSRSKCVWRVHGCVFWPCLERSPPQVDVPFEATPFAANGTPWVDVPFQGTGTHQVFVLFGAIGTHQVGCPIWTRLAPLVGVFRQTGHFKWVWDSPAGCRISSHQGIPGGCPVLEQHTPSGCPGPGNVHTLAGCSVGSKQDTPGGTFAANVTSIVNVPFGSNGTQHVCSGQMGHTRWFFAWSKRGRPILMRCPGGCPILEQPGHWR